MKKFLTLIFIVFSFTLTIAQDGANFCSQAKIKAFERLNKIYQIEYPGDSNIDVTYYKLNLNLTYSPKNITGVVTVNAKAVTNQLTNFFLDLVNALTVTSVKLNGTTNLPFSQPASTSQLKINLDRAYSTGEEFSVDIAYNGTPGTSGFGSFIFSSHNGQPIIWSLSEPYGAKDWWPSKDTPGDKADSSDVWITAASNYVSVSNGKLIAVIDNGNGTKTYKWKNSYPIAGYLISIAMTNYALHEDQFNYGGNSPMPVTHYVYPENLQQNIANLDRTITMLQIFSQKFGPYPFLREKYGHAQFGWGGGMEHQTITSLVSFDEMLVVHELSHQWYGDKVTCKDWQNIWLNEGFASYAECIYTEAVYGTPDFKNYVQNFMNQAKNAVGTIYVQNINDENQIFNSAREYKKGAIVLHMLRGIVGDSTFFQIMRQYANEPGLAYNVATTEDFQRIAERVSGLNLNYFFHEWIYGDSYPKYTTGWNATQISGNSYKLHLRLMQNSNPSNNPPFFTMPVQVRYTTPLETKTITIFNEVQDQGWDITVNGQPSSVTFDPDNWILKDIVGTTNNSDGNSIPTNFSLSQNYPNPFNPETTISYQLPINSFVTLKVYDELGKEAATLVDGFQQAGIHNSQFAIRNSQLSSGVYYYTLKAVPSAGSGNIFIETKKMILLK